VCLLTPFVESDKNALWFAFAVPASGEYQPAVLNSCSVALPVDDIPVELGIWNTAAQHHFAQLRTSSYQQADVLVICFSIGSPSSLASVAAYWHPEVSQHFPSVPVVLVGTNLEARSDEQVISVGHGQGVAMQRRIGAVKYVECSVLKQQGVQQVLDAAARCVLFPQRPSLLAQLIQLFRGNW
jgi:GTPase SAR1 family protein